MAKQAYLIPVSGYYYLKTVTDVCNYTQHIKGYLKMTAISG